MSKDIRAKKAELRAEIRSLGSMRPYGSEPMIDILVSTQEYAQSSTILAFYGVGFEPDTVPFIRRALEDGKRLCLPVCTGTNDMQAWVVSSLSELTPGMYGIPEPPPGSEVVTAYSLDLIIVPGLCFDETGYRLGHGAGYYDRYLTSCQCESIGLCFESRLLPAVPREENDIPVSAIVTERRYFSTLFGHSSVKKL